MDCYINDKGKLYISVGQTDDDAMYNGYITLDKEDVTKTNQSSYSNRTK